MYFYPDLFLQKQRSIYRDSGTYESEDERPEKNDIVGLIKKEKYEIQKANKKFSKIHKLLQKANRARPG